MPTEESLAWLALPNGTVVIGHGPFTESAEPPESGTAFHVQDFALGDPRPWKRPREVETLAAADWAARMPSLPTPDITWQPPSAAPFTLVFEEILQAVRAGIFEKTVPVVTEIGSASCAPGPAITAAMARQKPPLIPYGWTDGASGFAGATPELLVSIQDRELQTMALAGTARDEDRDAFEADDKEIREHEYVAQTLVSKLTELGDVHRSPREILQLGSIVHFLSRIRVDLHHSIQPDDLIRRLHPTPALGPLPRTPHTLEKLIDWRQRLGCPPQFGAPFGLLHEGRFQSVVAIRGIWWRHHHLLLPAGCGLIEASRLAQEWRELRLKREAVKAFLG
jgi:menaquinone-specific isochorismate synthase